MTNASRATHRARRAWPRLIAAALVVATPAAAKPSPGAADAASAWLAAQQLPGGAFGSDAQPADQVADAVAALAVAGIGGDVRDRALARIRRDGPARAEQASAYAARIVLALTAIGEDPRDYDGFDYVAAVTAPYNDLLASHGGNLYSEALSGLGRIAADAPLPPAFLDRLQDAQCPGGGYAYSDRCGRPPDADTTSLILSVLSLAGAGNDAPAIAPSLDWLRALQAPSGAVPLEATFEPNANSTGLVVSALVTLGIDPRTWRRKGDPVDALASEFATDEGGLSFVAGGDANQWATVQGLPGLLEAGFPLRARTRTAAPTPQTTERAPGGTGEPRTATATPVGGTVATPSPSGHEPQATPSATPTLGLVRAAGDGDGQGSGGTPPWLLIGALAGALALAGIGIRRGSSR